MTDESTPRAIRDEDRLSVSTERLHDLLVRADRAALQRSVAPGLTHILTNAIQARSTARPSAETKERANPRLAAAARVLEGMARSEEVSPAPVVVAETLAAVEEWQRCQSDLPQMEVRIEVEKSLPATRVRSAHLTHVLQALVTNAKEALRGAGKGEIALQAFTGASEITLAVEDGGPGIPADSREKVFGLFYTTKDRRRHLGLGLTVARYLLELDGGGIEIEPTAPGAGARLILKLPVWERRTS